MKLRAFTLSLHDSAVPYSIFCCFICISRDTPGPATRSGQPGTFLWGTLRQKHRTPPPPLPPRTPHPGDPPEFETRRGEDI